MANLDDLPIPSISEMDPDEAIEYLRRIRLARRTPTKVQKPTTNKKKSVTATPTMSATQAAELLKLIEENEL